MFRVPVPSFAKTDLHDLDNLYVLRDALESCAAGEAARYITDHQLEELESILNESQEIAQQIERHSKEARHQTANQCVAGHRAAIP